MLIWRKRLAIRVFDWYSTQVHRRILFLKPKVSLGPIKVLATNNESSYELEKYQAHSSEELVIMGSVDGLVYPLKWWEKKLSYWHTRFGWYKAVPQVLCIIEDALQGRTVGCEPEPTIKRAKIPHRMLKYRKYLQTEVGKPSPCVPNEVESVPVAASVMSSADEVALAQAILRKLGVAA
jgi:hypothetical protein